MSQYSQNPDYVGPAQWQQAVGYSRQACARVFRDGGTPADALSAFGLTADTDHAGNWDKTVDAIASLICQQQLRRAA